LISVDVYMVVITSNDKLLMWFIRPTLAIYVDFWVCEARHGSYT